MKLEIRQRRSVALHVIALLLLATQAAIAQTSFDNLTEPYYRSVFSSDPVLSTKFFSAPFNCGRFFTLGGASVSVYCDPKTEECRATLVSASKDLTKVASSHLRDVPVNRTETPIPRDVAMAIRRAWALMLERPRVPDRPSIANTVTLDGFADEFSLDEQDNSILHGVTPTDKHAWGPHVRKMWDIGVLLIDYCKSDEKKRQQLAEGIKRKAIALATTLESKTQ